jgi:CheY-like chemotaxis protein
MPKILLAGQDAACLDILSAELAAEGYEIQRVWDGQTAYENVLATLPDLVFIELNLPVFNAYETCSLVRRDPSVPPGLPIFLFAESDFDPVASRKAGFTGVFPKRHLVLELRDLLAGHLGGTAAAGR